MATVVQNRFQFRNATRQQESMLAGIERACLLWLAARMPARINSDHLTLLGMAATLLAAASYASARWWPAALFLANFWIAVNWFGDSLDGTLARYRNQQRPRYGFYVDHIIDSVGAVFLLGGLAVSGYMSAWLAAALLIAFLVLSINVYLATYTRGTFQLSFWKFSPTELRILMCIGNVVACLRPRVLGGRYLFFDVGGAIALAIMIGILLVSIARNTRALYEQEKIK